MTGASLVRSDATAIPLGDSTVDLIVTSPPYFALRSYQDGGEHYDGQIGSEPAPTAFLEALWAVTAECWRVLKPSGSLFVNLGDKYAGSGGHNNNGISGPSSKSTLGNPHYGRRMAEQSQVDASRRTGPNRYTQASDGVRAKSLMGLPWRYAIGCIDGQADPDGRGWVLRSEIVWSKPNGLPESVTDRVRRSHEQWFHLTKEGRYYSNVDEVREPTQGRPGRLTWDERKALGDDDSRARYSSDNGHGGSGGMADNPLGKLPGSVWTVPTQPLIVPDWLNVDHFAAFPTEWPRRIILGWSPPRVCSGCGGPRVESEHGTRTTALPSVRRTDHSGPHQAGGGQGTCEEDQPLLFEALLDEVDGREPGEHQGLRDDDKGVQGAPDAGPPNGGPDGLRDGAPGDHGGVVGPESDGRRGGASPERGQAGQPTGEPSGDAEAPSRSDVRIDEAPSDRVSVLRSRGPRHADCPQCGETETSPAVVLDVFGGTGTTAMVARALGRYGVSCDLSADYQRLATWRIWQSGQAARVASKTDGERQLDLFGGAA